jgi:endonuclease/exonuclease/phosphatase family metal-dependent hydrolase
MQRWGLASVVLAAVLGVLLVSGGSADRAAAQCGGADGSLRVMTYNIRTALGTKNPGKNPLHQLFEPHDFAPVVAAIAAADADVLALQEVLGWGQTRRIARALEMDSAFVFHPSPLPWWGTAVLSRCKLSEVRREVISRGKGNGKAMVVAQVDVAGRDVVVTSLHRDRDDNGGVQVRRTLGALQSEVAPVVLMGDFNFTPNDKRHGVVSGAYDDSVHVAQSGADYVETRGTYPVIAGSKPHRQIDYVFLSKGDFAVSDVRVIEGVHSKASDHLGFVADVTLTPRPQ